MHSKQCRFWLQIAQVHIKLLTVQLQPCNYYVSMIHIVCLPSALPLVLTLHLHQQGEPNQEVESDFWILMGIERSSSQTISRFLTWTSFCHVKVFKYSQVYTNGNLWDVFFSDFFQSNQFQKTWLAIFDLLQAK